MDITALQKENQYLKHAVDELSFLNELSRAIGSMFNSEEIMQTIIKKSIRAIKAEQGVVILVVSEGDIEMKTLVRSMVSYGSHKPYSLDQSLLGWMHLNKKPISINDPKNDTRFSGFQLDKSIKSVACVPLLVKSELTGILSVFNKKGGMAFTDDDLRLLYIIASHSAQIVENARLYEEEQAHLKLKEETRLAREIQINLLPESNPAVGGYDIAGKSIPALSVGGDYYDFIPIDDDNIAVCLGDISGKGMPSALLMSNLQATVRGQTLISGSPKDCIDRSNRLLFRSTDTDKFATLFYGILNLGKNEFYYTNAGHNPPMLFKDKSNPMLLKEGGPILGFIDNIEYECNTISFETGDLCVIYSDGITEAINTSGNEFGEEKLKVLIKENWNLSSDEIIEKIFKAVKEHSRGVPQSDDITMVVLKRK